MDTIRILVATDNHVGYEERDPIRGDDAWKSFDEVMTLARKEDVDMVLLAGDLFHDNKPSRKAMYKVMRSLRKNCLGMKPCELQFMSDANEVFDGAFTHVNYEDPDINISIPVFSIHGNHDDPSGDGNFCSLDLLQVAGLVNYFGRIPEADKPHARPVLLQKGQTKLALYGLSNVRDERMYRNFRDHKVKWFRPNIQSSDWFNLLAIHQNHHAHTATGYLPEEMLPEWLNLVVWGHEHECLIDPVENPVTGFHVMQPGSSVATSLVPGEAVAKHVAVVNITGKQFQVEKHRLKSVRPFMTGDIVLANDKRFKGLDKKKDHRIDIIQKLMAVVEEMIEEANADWDSVQDRTEDGDEGEGGGEPRPLPLIRLKVEYTTPDGGQYDIENPQRFSNRFAGKVANTNDVVYFYCRKKSARNKTEVADPDGEGLLAALREGNTIEVGKLVEEYLEAQSLKILPQAPFGDAVNQFVNKDDKGAMDSFVMDSLKAQVKQMLLLDNETEDLDDAMEKYKKLADAAFRSGKKQPRPKRTLKPQPDDYDSDLDGLWEGRPEAWQIQPDHAAKSQPTQAKGRGRKSATVVDDEDEDMNDVKEGTSTAKPRGRPKAAAKPTTSRPSAKAPAKPPAKKPATKGRGCKASFAESEEEEEEVVMDEDDEEPPAPPTRTPATRFQPARSQPLRAAPKRQTKLNFSQKPSRGVSQAVSQAMEISDDEISEDEDFAPPAPPPKGRRRG